MKLAEKRVCICDHEDSNVVYTDTIPLTNHELDSIDGYYCIQCNSFWREP
jgi:hypothetical protein